MYLFDIYRLYKKKGEIIDLIDTYTAKVKVDNVTIKIDQVIMICLIYCRTNYRQRFLKLMKKPELLMDLYLMNEL